MEMSFSSFCHRFALLLLAGAWAALAIAASPGETAQDSATDLIKDVIFQSLGAVGGVVDTVDDLALDPVVSYATTADDAQTINNEAADAAFLKLLEGSINVTFPELGFAIKGGKLIVGGTAAAIEIALNEVYESGRDVALYQTIFGSSDGPDVFLGNIDQLFAQQSFFGDFLARRSPPITAETIGAQVQSKRELEKLWFTYYKNTLQGGPLGLSPALREQVDSRLNEAWPQMLAYWQAKRAQVVLANARTVYHDRLRTAVEKLAEQKQQDQEQQQAGAVENGGATEQPGVDQEQIAGWRATLECLEEGARKYPNYWQDCNGNWTMRSRDVEIAYYRNLLRQAGVETGGSAAATAPSGEVLAGPLEQGVNRFGGDYRGEEMSNADPGQCQALCLSEARCIAFSYVRPGIQGEHARCWLKDSVPEPSDNACCTSGTVTR
ncbi:MAG: PAN domain-containing protein [Pseudomonas sp.]|uniref:PAN domain-containing protein n=1 Tax=Pseudomonas sp. TaxID=306 RepID=UPI0027337A84|nr:PAN domain-containing protein [Pseudomonas sp.]MDP3846622.1 PAN domain-containing protein [Pseudomonas sp.]